MANDETVEVERQILQYLRECPQACDTLEGIAKWWVMRQRLNDTVDIVQKALERLKSEGLLDEHKGPGRKTLYSATRK